MIRRILLPCLLACAISVAAHAAETPSAFVQGLGNHVLSLLDRQKTAGEDASTCFHKLLVTDFDIPTIGRFVIGTAWRGATPEERKAYMDLFENLVVDVYNDRFQDYSSEGFEVIGEMPENAKDTRVRSRIVRPGKPPVNVEWRVRAKDGGFRIVDVSVEGVSMTLTQRSEFASILDRNGGRVQALVDRLAEDRVKRDAAKVEAHKDQPPRPETACP
ncbi:MAG TPA: toluene tolerance protein [Rhodospirillaceae bacterium]|nr:toluene tolerance protein [Rhodospirillaceae bacterium]